ncbi:unnamed protein product [Lepeophtheirus salmonis]|uniref:(salmon louse) hypothetical protein n=1 Tax=Lepeophtheirus salmonis TaxID=72036 RepID=A0A7R8CV50_LEPSM|nr:unnamed protein product [Lepeophtheirus salmonis]CAF2906833.1 unnamed protein product [Lepeophtheirus salmonis]
MKEREEFASRKCNPRKQHLLLLYTFEPANKLYLLTLSLSSSNSCMKVKDIDLDMGAKLEARLGLAISSLPLLPTYIDGMKPAQNKIIFLIVDSKLRYTSILTKYVGVYVHRNYTSAAILR